MTTHQDTSTEREEPGPVKATPYNPTSEMLWAMKRIDPALTLEQCRSLWAVAWQAALSSRDEVAKEAWEMADAMLKARGQ